MAQNENISLSLANKVDILNKSQSVDARYGVYDNESDALASMLSYGLDGRQVAVYKDKENGKTVVKVYNEVLHQLEPLDPEVYELIAEGAGVTLEDNGDGTFSLKSQDDTILSTINKASLVDNEDGTFTFNNTGDSGDDVIIDFSVTVQKQSEQWASVILTETTATMPQINENNRNINITGNPSGLSSLGGFVASGGASIANFWDGMTAKVLNSSPNNQTIKHNYSEADIKYLFPNEEDYTIRPNEVVYFDLKGGNLVFRYSTFLDAKNVFFDNTESGLEAENVQDAVDESFDFLNSNKYGSFVDKLYAENPLSYRYFVRTSSYLTFVYVYGDKAICYEMELNPSTANYLWIRRIWYRNINENGLAIETGQQELSRNVQEYAVRYKKSGTTDPDIWSPYHGAGSAITELNSLIINIDGIDYNYEDIPFNENIIFKDATIKQNLDIKYSDTDTNPQLNIDLCHKFDDKQLHFSNTYKILEDIDVLRFFGSRSSINFKTKRVLDDGTELPVENTNNIYSIAKPIQSTYGENAYAFAANFVDNVNKNTSFGKYFSDRFRIQYWDGGGSTLYGVVYWILSKFNLTGSFTTIFSGEILNSDNNVFYIPKGYEKNDIEINLPLSEGLKRNAKTSDLINDGSNGTSTYVESDELSEVAFSNSYNDLDDLPTIPTKTSDLTNDGDGVSSFVTYNNMPTPKFDDVLGAGNETDKEAAFKSEVSSRYSIVSKERVISGDTEKGAYTKIDYEGIEHVPEGGQGLHKVVFTQDAGNGEFEHAFQAKSGTIAHVGDIVVFNQNPLNAVTVTGTTSPTTLLNVSSGTITLSEADLQVGKTYEFDIIVKCTSSHDFKFRFGLGTTYIEETISITGTAIDIPFRFLGNLDIVDVGGNPDAREYYFTAYYFIPQSGFMGGGELTGNETVDDVTSGADFVFDVVPTDNSSSFTCYKAILKRLN